MRQLKWLSLLGLLLLGPSTYAQSVRYQSQAISSRGAGIANATIAICMQPAVTTTQPCSPLATLATSTSTTSGGANPLTADSFGNFFFYAAPGRYTVQIYGPAVFGQFIVVDTVVPPDTSGPITITGSPFTFTNHNGICWAGSVTSTATPTIDNGLSLCNTGATRVDIAPPYSGSESASVTSLPTGIAATVFSGTGIVFDNRQKLGTVGNTNSNTLYPVMYGSRELGAIAVEGVNKFNTGTIPDSTCSVCDTNFLFNATFPTNGGAQDAHISVLIAEGSETIGGSNSPFIGMDSETFWAPSSVDTGLPYAAGYTGQMHNRGVGNISTATAYLAQPCEVTSTGSDAICYGFDTFKHIAGSANYGYHNPQSWATEINGTFDVFDVPVTITSCSEAATTVTCLATNTYTTSDTVLVQGVGGSFPSSTNFGYNGKFAVTSATGTQFQYTAVSGLTAATGGTAKGILQIINPQSSDESIRSTELSDSVGFIWQRRSDHATIMQLSNSTGLKATGFNCIGDGGCFLGGTGSASAGFVMKEGTFGGGAAGYDICQGVSATHTVQCSYNNGTAASLTQTIASGTSTMTSGAITAATCQTAVTTAATNTATTDSIEWAYATAPTLTTDALLLISPYVTSGNVNFTRCNPTAGSITGTAIVINWRVVR